jgi:biopolymer transport protein TolQ
MVGDAVMASSGLEKAILAILTVLSILSWAVIIMKVRALRRAKRNDDAFRTAFTAASHTGGLTRVVPSGSGPAPLQSIFSAAQDARAQAQAEATAVVETPPGELPLKSPHQLEERVRLAMEHARKAEYAEIGRNLSVLATAGSASPFIGLLGTVWGILATFQMLGAVKSASIQVLGPPIAGALIATAMGLFVAIPAVMFYNWITSRMDEEQELASCFSESLLRLLRATGGVDEGKAAAAAPAAQG